MSEMNRREALTLIALAPFATKLEGRPPGLGVPPEHAARAGKAGSRELKFFTPHEFATVGVLADLILPADERSGSATDAGVPEFLDFILSDVSGAGHAGPVRGGLAWLDAESRRRSGKNFVDAAAGEQTALLDDIAWPEQAPPELSHGVAFFARFRDLVASGFWSSQMGVQDLQYMGNVPVMEWNGCPPEALRKLGVAYET